MLYRGKGGIQYDLSPPSIASGGEGEIYSINGKPNIVAKIYKPSKISAEKEHKLVKMIGYRPAQKMLDQIAWPQDVLYDSNGQFAGFVMPKMSVNEDLNVIYEYGASAKYPDISWENRILIAENLCAVLHSIHNWGHVCGDLNPKNISVDPNTGYVIFLDTDSYHIQDGVNIYRCDVGIPEYLPTEVQMKMRGGNTLATVKLPTFSQDTDNFALAIHIFQLLMNGVHPFACTIIPSQSSVTAPQPADNIIRGEFPFMQNIPGIKIPPYAPEITILPKSIQSLFERVFIDGHSSPGKRPRPEDWHTALRNLRQNLKQCKQVNHHQHFKSLSDCPWCKADHSFNQILKPPTLSQTTFQPPSKPSVRAPSPYGATPSIPAPAPSVRTPATRSVASARFAATLLGLITGASLFAFIYKPWVYSSVRELNLISTIGLFSIASFAIGMPNGWSWIRLVAIAIASFFLHKICTDLAIYGSTFGQQRLFDSPLQALNAIIVIGAIIGVPAGYRIGNVIPGRTRNKVFILGTAICLVFVGPLSTAFSLPEFAKRLIVQKIGDDKGNPMHAAALHGQVVIMRWLKKQGGDINAKADGYERRNWLPIHYAAFGGQIEAMAWLMGQGADVNAKVEPRGLDGDEASPMHIAAYGGQVEAMQWLKAQGGNVNAKGAYDVTTMHSAASAGQVEAMKWLKTQGVEIPKDIMFAAARHGHIAALKWLKEQGADVNEPRYDWFPMHHAAVSGQVEAMKWLKEQGASIAVKSDAGLSPMHLATQNGHLAAMKWLKAQGADINEEGGKTKYFSNRRPIHMAVEGGHLEVLKWLIEQGVDINMKDSIGFTPMHHAAWRRKIAILEWLKKEGADMNVKNSRGETPLAAARKSGFGDDLNKTIQWLENNGAHD